MGKGIHNWIQLFRESKWRMDDGAKKAVADLPLLVRDAPVQQFKRFIGVSS